MFSHDTSCSVGCAIMYYCLYLLSFFREAIFGYQDLKIQLYYSAARLTTYFGITYSDKVTPDKFEGIEVRFCFVFLQCFVFLLFVFLLRIQLQYIVTQTHRFSI